MAGKLAVHAVRVVPGPMAKQWVELAQQIEAIAKRRDLAAAGPSQPISLLTIQDQQVNFRVVDGRVYHQNMQFQVGDVTLRSEGSVGLDETLALVLHVPIQDKWIEGQAFLVGLRGQSLAIPVKGTLRQPQLDRGAVAGLSQQLLQGAAQQAIGGELNKAFDKLFKPRQ
jgi:translocation and assembly module TamB